MPERYLIEAAQYESNAAQAKYNRELELSRPFHLLRPSVSLDGDKWCALYGDNIQIGVCAFGDTPSKAAEAFDSAWNGA